MDKRLLIAVDGPAASGKGTLAKRLAQYFGLAHLDTGAIYRAVGFKMMQNNLVPSDEKMAVSTAESIQFEDINNPNLYNEGVGAAASIVSAIPGVRKALFDFQKDFASQNVGAVLDGRDIGTVICPDADFKFYITADLEARAKRRYKQLQSEDNSVIYTTVLENLRLRDERDSKRDISPLKKAEDAFHMDTTQMNADAVFDMSLSFIGSRQPELLKL